MAPMVIVLLAFLAVIDVGSRALAPWLSRVRESRIFAALAALIAPPSTVEVSRWAWGAGLFILAVVAGTVAGGDVVLAIPAIAGLRLERGQVVEQMRKLADKAETEKRKLTTEEDQEWARLDAAQEDLNKRIERETRVGDLERELGRPQPTKAGERVGDESPQYAEHTKAHSEAFRSYLRYGYDSLTPEQRDIMRRTWQPLREGVEHRALSVGTTTAGGFTVPEGFSGMLERDVKAFGGMREAARVLPTASGNDLPWPTVTDVANVGELLAENTAAAEQDTTFGQIILKAYKYSSKLVRVSIELLQDTAFDIEGLLSGLFAERIARITNTHFTTGDNTAKPQGVVTFSIAGKTGAAGQTASVIYEDLVDLEHSIDPAIRIRPGVRWMMHDSMLKVLKKLKDGQGRPLWIPSVAGGAPATIGNYPYTINQDVAEPAASAKSLLFGDFQKYIIRDVRDFSVLRLVERYAEFGQVAFIAFTRHDGRVLDAGTDPVKHFAHPAA